MDGHQNNELLWRWITITWSWSAWICLAWQRMGGTERVGWMAGSVCKRRSGWGVLLCGSGYGPGLDGSERVDERFVQRNLTSVSSLLI